MTKRQTSSQAFEAEGIRLLEHSDKPPADLARELGVRRTNCISGTIRPRPTARTPFPAPADSRNPPRTWPA